jgi:hypothetical protein
MIIFKLEPYEETLINKAAEKMGQTNQDDKVFLKPLGRYGKTKAKLFLISVPTASLSRVVKLDTVENITRERTNTNSIIHDFDLHPEIFYYSLEDGETNAGGKAIILYKIEGDKELKDLLNSCIKGMSLVLTKPKQVLPINVMKELPNPSTTPSNEGVDFEKIKQLIENVMERLPDPIETLPNEKVNEAFKEYLREGAGFEKIKQYAHGDDTFPYIKNKNATWKQLVHMIYEFLDSEIELKIGAIHGDLHPSNIMVDTTREYKVNLIDFAWAQKKGITAVDYAMMENSIHYMWAPCWLPEYFWHEFDEYSLKGLQLDPESKITFLNSLKGKKYLNDWSEAIWGITHIVRTYANTRNLSHQELLAARIALLLGQAKFEDYPPVRIGPQLWRLLEAWEKQTLNFNS